MRPASCWRTWWPLQLALGLPLLALMPGSVHAADAAELKVAIVYNVLQFVEWPTDGEAAAGNKLTLCVDPRGQLGGYFKSLAGRPVNKRQLDVVEMADSFDAWKTCHAVFLDATSRRAPALAARLPTGAPLLVLGDLGNGHAEAMVQLVEINDRIGFNIDLAAARRARLLVSSRLLRLAKKVTE